MELPGFLALFHKRIVEEPDRVAVVDGVRRVTRQQLHDEALSLGSGLLARGIRKGAAIAFQLPNWHEACVIHLAATLYGFRLIPLLPMYRESELRLILRECKVEAVFLPLRLRGFSYVDLYDRLELEPGSLKHVFGVRGDDARLSSYQELVFDDAPHQGCVPAEPDDVKMVLYTSGSTGRPKGVLHTQRTMDSLVHFAAGFWGLSQEDVLLVPSPLGHIGGSMYAFELPWVAGVRAVLMDVWDPEVAVKVINEEQVSFCAGATPFLEGLLKAAETANSDLPSLRRFVCGGASVPAALVARASQRFSGCTVSRAYGSTEVPLVCPGIRTREDGDMGAQTDGECAADVLFLDDAGRPVPAGQPGEIVARAPRMFAGYLNAQDNEAAFTDDGYFRMGDMGRLIDGRFIEITGRKKDIIIRSGENISPLEIENALASHPAIKQVAVVGIPDVRTGEAAMAVAVLRENSCFDLDELRAHLSNCGLAKQKWPEHLRIVEALPTNAIGKVLKQELKKGAFAG